jgi:hypothetical protein
MMGSPYSPKFNTRTSDILQVNQQQTLNSSGYTITYVLALPAASLPHVAAAAAGLRNPYWTMRRRVDDSPRHRHSGTMDDSEVAAPFGNQRMERPFPERGVLFPLFCPER